MADNIKTPGVATPKKVILEDFVSYFDVHTRLCFRK